MISVEYVQVMARYNAWQNETMIGLAETLDPAELTRDCGAFFRSILGTLNHLLWVDRLWMSRLADWKQPEGSLADSAQCYPTLAAWKCDRMRADARILLWARQLRPAQLRGTLAWRSASKEVEVTSPIGLCVVHMFNHQTHHRGQIHAMMSAAGAVTGLTDLVFMPERI
ncbi:DinB family protein [Tropicimonas sp. IMCC34043]|uniref:DinB family protein n=1 Tax=Tropicimonas sp. IMCC34043 TaxID=2248760 RepID=UPI000E25777B|nr:DinB family protein [Tropicimonas sp. IMCC34043]